tara:strand:- start:33181 stop:33507 length:327 start_codon:yes stop_codon:yes gene_type:complete
MADIVRRLRDSDTTRRIGESYADVHDRRQADRDEAAAKITRFRAEVERLRAQVDNLKRMVIAQEKLLRSKDAKIERLMSVVERVYQSSAQKHIIELTHAAITQEERDE